MDRKFGGGHESVDDSGRPGLRALLATAGMLVTDDERAKGPVGPTPSYSPAGGISHPSEGPRGGRATPPAEPKPRYAAALSPLRLARRSRPTCGGACYGNPPRAGALPLRGSDLERVPRIPSREGQAAQPLRERSEWRGARRTGWVPVLVGTDSRPT